MTLAILPVELIRLIVEIVGVEPQPEIKEDGIEDEDNDSDDDTYYSDSYPDQDIDRTPAVSPLDPDIRLRDGTLDGTPNGPQLRCILNARDLNAMARSCRRLGSVVNSLLYEANREFQTSSAVFWAAAVGRTETLAWAQR
ncbi:hypothetical protein BU23DRAFT_554057 [Bimuria novae-zelandiae CBS 107.79]|uniref:Uncharacterized protein n=1 Tax=Bimuria novae-zelandiae CBS 107.79 TaxID=1447943 RepID=A0A6A5VAS5_9PLEO|nr:hypothetical protein BU23DRAFT_554057 [Bimuria novae-zelandiae CBS 107.79]